MWCRCRNSFRMLCFRNVGIRKPNKYVFPEAGRDVCKRALRRKFIWRLPVCVNVRQSNMDGRVRVKCKIKYDKTKNTRQVSHSQSGFWESTTTTTIRYTTRQHSTKHARKVQLNIQKQINSVIIQKQPYYQDHCYKHGVTKAYLIEAIQNRKMNYRADPS